MLIFGGFLQGTSLGICPGGACTLQQRVCSLCMRTRWQRGEELEAFRGFWVCFKLHRSVAWFRGAWDPKFRLGSQTQKSKSCNSLGDLYLLPNPYCSS